MRPETFPLALHPPDPAVRFRPLTESDAPLLIALWEGQAEKAGQILQTALRLARQGRGGGLVMMSPDRAMLWGYGQLTLWADCAEISDLMIAPEQRGRGLGTALIQLLCQQAQKSNADYAEIGALLSNSRALALYRRLGFCDYHTLTLIIEGKEHPAIYLRLPLRRR